LPRDSRIRAASGFAICAGEVPLLTGDQERTLAERIAKGDQKARDHLIQANLRLVVTIARGYDRRGLEPEDLVAEGYVGLIHAAERYDPGFNTRFSTYASLWIKQAIRAALCNTTATIRIPVHAFNLLSKWRRAKIALERALGREAGFDEIADTLGLTEGQRRIIEQALLARRRCDPGETPREPAVPADDPLADMERAEQRQELHRQLERLSPIERSVIILRYGLENGEPLTLTEAGQRLGWTREWVRKNELRALAKLS
jgi:RNA polymerase primary sigma factor